MILSCPTYAKKDNIYVKHYIEKWEQQDALNNVVDFVKAVENRISTWPNADKDPITDVKKLKNTVPAKYSLSQNYPNPFNPTTKIEYSIPQSDYISLKVYNVLGQDISRLFKGYQKPGNYKVNFNGSNLSSGAYLYRLETGDVSITKKFVLIK